MTDQDIRLYLVPTPIGNLDDITLRSIQILQHVDTILAEDTRTSGKLLKHLNIKKPLQSYHIFNEQKIVQKLIDRMQKGEVMALISDAGTPGIADPGFLLVRHCLQSELKIQCLPGATALIPALVNSGLPSDRFTFEGFLPHKKGRTKHLESLKNETRTMIFYESPHRLLKTIQQFKDHFGPNRQVSVSKELSKLHENTYNGSLNEIHEILKKVSIKGEFVIVVAGCNFSVN